MKKIPGLSARAMADGGDLARPPHAQVDSVESPGVAVPSVNAATFFHAEPKTESRSPPRNGHSFDVSTMPFNTGKTNLRGMVCLFV